MSHVHGCNLQKDECIDLYRDQLKTWRHKGQELETQVERLSSEVAEQAAEIETVTLREKAEEAAAGHHAGAGAVHS